MERLIENKNVMLYLSNKMRCRAFSCERENSHRYTMYIHSITHYHYQPTAGCRTSLQICDVNINAYYFVILPVQNYKSYIL